MGTQPTTKTTLVDGFRRPPRPRHGWRSATPHGRPHEMWPQEVQLQLQLQLQVQGTITSTSTSTTATTTITTSCQYHNYYYMYYALRSLGFAHISTSPSVSVSRPFWHASTSRHMGHTAHTRHLRTFCYFLSFRHLRCLIDLSFARGHTINTHAQCTGGFIRTCHYMYNPSASLFVAPSFRFSVPSAGTVTPLRTGVSELLRTLGRRPARPRKALPRGASVYGLERRARAAASSRDVMPTATRPRRGRMGGVSGYVGCAGVCSACVGVLVGG